MLTGLNQQIVTAYDELGLDIDSIAEQFEDIDPLAIKATLMQFSSKYRAAIKAIPNHDFSDPDMEDAKQTLIRLMHHSEDENLMFRAAKYIRDDKKGRLDAINGLKGMNVNIAIFNQRLQEARKAKELSKAQVAAPVPAPQTKDTIDQEDKDLIEA